MRNTLATDQKEEEILVVMNGQCRIWMGEMKDTCFITISNQKTTEKIIVSVLSKELNERSSCLTEKIRKREFARRERAVQIAAQIFWQYPKRTLWLKVQQLNQRLKMENIRLLAVEYMAGDLQKTKLFPKVEDAKIGGKVFQTGAKDPNMNICILQK